MGEKTSNRGLGETHVSIRTRRTVIVNLVGCTISMETNLCKRLSKLLESPHTHTPVCVAASREVGAWTKLKGKGVVSRSIYCSLLSDCECSV